MSAEALMNAQRLVRRLPVGESVVEAILDLVRSGPPGRRGPRRRHRQAPLGSGPARQPGADAGGARPRPDRGARRALASTTCVALAEPVLKHRMALTFSARADGETHPERHRPPDRAARRG